MSQSKILSIKHATPSGTYNSKISYMHGIPVLTRHYTNAIEIKILN